MKNNKIILILLCVFILFAFTTSTVAAEDIATNTTDNSAVETVESDVVDENVNAVGETHVVNGSAKNQMNDPTIQTAINNAKAGDTIEITGTSYEHCHFVVDKQLTIKSTVGTEMSACPSSTTGSNGIGIFYITPEASGTILSGFTLINEEYKSGTVDPYGIYVNGANNITIDNVNVQKVSNGPGIYVNNTVDIKIQNSQVTDSINGIYIENSDDINIKNSTIEENTGAGIYFGENNKNSFVINNTIANNNYRGIYYGSGNLAIISNNIIKDNRNDVVQSRATAGEGIYVNNNITKMNITGNFIYENGNYGIFNNYVVKNLVNQYVEYIENNYFVMHNTRVVFTQKHETGGTGPIYVGSNFYILETFCGGTYYEPGVLIGDHERDLVLGDIKELKKGVYYISFIRKDTQQVADKLNCVEITFYINKNSTYPTPQEGDIYKTVQVINGTATVDFTEEFEKMNVKNITAVGIGYGQIGNVNRPSAFYEVDNSTITSTNLTGSNVIGNANDSIVYEVTLTDLNGVVLNGKEIVFNFNNKTTTVTTNSQGKANITISSSTAGIYNITAEFKGDKYYSASKTTNLINIIDPTPVNQTTVLTSNNLTKKYGIAGAYNVSLTSNGAPIANKTVFITINGVKYNRTTDENGIAKLNINLNPGIYNTLVVFRGDEEYKSSICEGHVQVLSATDDDLRDLTYIKSNNLNQVYGENKIFKMTLYNNDEVLVNQNVQITINGVTYNKVTDENGQAYLNIKLGPGNYTLDATYNGNNIYQSCHANSIVTVNNPTDKKATVLSCEDYTQEYGENGAFYVNLTDSNGEPLTNQNINILINGVNYTRSTDSNGIAKLNIRLNEGTYTIISSYSGNSLYNASNIQTNIVTVTKPSEKINTIISAENFTEMYGENKDYTVVLKDENGSSIANQAINLIINGVKYSRTTDSNGVAKLAIKLLPNTYTIQVSYDGNSLYNPSNELTNIVEVLDIKLVGDVTNSELQAIINSVSEKTVIKLAGYSYNNISININKPIILTTVDSTLNGAENKDVITINVDGATVNGFNIVANNGSGIVVKGNDNIISENVISSNLDPDLIDKYEAATISMPGYGIALIGANNTKTTFNKIYNFYNGIFIENSTNNEITNSTITKNNYGIEFGYNSANTLIENNEINKNTGLITLDVVEGPSGYGISLRHSGVNVTILNNNINNNYMGLFIDAKNCTGIVIIGNSISNSTVEGITFNENYTYAENAIQPEVHDNAIYNNAKGPSMIVLGEVSANPAGIYGPGEWNDTLKLKLGTNWYGTNTYTKWGENATGVGTICPRISTTLIHYNVTYIGNGEYSVKFYNNDTLATTLPDLETYFTLNYYTDKEIEIMVTVHEGQATFSFPAENYYETGNILEGSSGSLFDINRLYPIIYTYNIPDDEIPEK